MSAKGAEALPSTNFIVRYCIQTLSITETDLRKLWHDPFELLIRMIQPAIWLVIFGEAMEKIKGISTAPYSYLDFIAPGILAQSTLFISIFFGIALIWERDTGILYKILVSPAPRSSLVIGRALAAGLRSVSQVFVIYFLAIILGIHVRWDFIGIVGVLATVMLGGAVFSTISLVTASIVKKRERFMGIGQILTMPLFFASNALYPIDMMPRWLQVVALLNPLSYQVDALRNFMITGASTTLHLTIDFAVGAIVFAIFVALAVRTYPKILF